MRQGRWVLRLADGTRFEWSKSATGKPKRIRNHFVPQRRRIRGLSGATAASIGEVGGTGCSRPRKPAASSSRRGHRGRRGSSGDVGPNGRDSSRRGRGWSRARASYRRRRGDGGPPLCRMRWRRPNMVGGGASFRVRFGWNRAPGCIPSRRGRPPPTADVPDKALARDGDAAEPVSQPDKARGERSRCRASNRPAAAYRGPAPSPGDAK